MTAQTAARARRNAQRLAEQDVITTFRRLLAAMIRKYGTDDVIRLNLLEIEDVRDGDLKVVDDPATNDVLLSIKVRPRASLVKLN
jgi:hypothetical protein